jgi:hypothetical protein
MVHPYYTEKILPFLENNKVVNMLVKTPFIGTGFELKELAKTLRADEELRYITACKSGEARVLVCVTNLRLHILDKGLVLNKYQLTVNLPQIASVQRGRGIFFGSVVISVMGFDDNIYLKDFWGKDTENFQRILQDSITDYGLGRSSLTQPNYYQPQQPYYLQESYYQQPVERRFQPPMYESNNPAYNYLTGEPFTEAELLEMGLDRFGQPLEKKQAPSQPQMQPSRTVSRPQTQQPTQSRVSQNQRPPLQPRVPRPPKDVSNMTTQEKFDALERGGWF